MKKTTLLCFILVFLLCGCDQKGPLIESYKDLRVTMKMFGDIETDAEAESNHFQVRLTSFKKMEIDDTVYYLYDVAFSFTRDQFMHVTEISFANNTKVEKEYMDSSSATMTRKTDQLKDTYFITKDDFESYLLKAVTPRPKEIADDDEMKEITLTFSFNGRKETVTINCPDAKEQYLNKKVPDKLFSLRLLTSEDVFDTGVPH